jgi:phage shock protein A
MAEALLKRMSRLFSAGAEDSVDRMEAAASERVMRETVREVDRAIDRVQAEYEEAVTRRLQAAKHQKMLGEKAAELEQKARFALGEDRTDLAEAALSRQVDCEEEAAKLTAKQSDSQAEETRLAENLAALKTRKASMEQALADFAAARREAERGGDGPARVRHDVEKLVRDAEHAFARVMANAGGVSVSPVDAAAASRVAEIDVMRKRAMVVSRLEALRQGLTSV